MRARNGADVLFVEDNPYDIDLTLRALKACGLENRVKVVRDGKEAVDYVFRTGPYQDRPREESLRLVLLDLKLPKMTGLQVLQWIRADPETKSLPVIILTTFEDDRDVVEIFRLGVTGYLVKPLRVEKFYDIARGLIDGIVAPPARPDPSGARTPGSPHP
jgi:CheY-like chemotaxis protein